ncbi:MAG: tol-pal system protein YbgF [Desulfatibacillum sp.]|nr:tol-pal system protein YbgF [Desulfatibacillum sp.]
MATALVLSLTGCSWINWPWSEKIDPQMEAAHRKLDTISTNTDIINQQVTSANKRLSVLEQRLLNMEGQLGSMEMLLEPTMIKSMENTLSRDATAGAESAPLEPTPYPMDPPIIVQVASKPALSPSKSPEDQYAAAYRLYQNRDREKAISAFESFLRDYPGHDLADNAQYWIGEAYYDGKMYPEAIQAFKSVVKNYPEKDKAPAALLKIGYSYLAVENLEQASQYLRQVVTDYPFSDLVGIARAKLADLQPAKGASDAFPNGSGS